MEVRGLASCGALPDQVGRIFDRLIEAGVLSKVCG